MHFSCDARQCTARKRQNGSTFCVVPTCVCSCANEAMTPNGARIRAQSRREVYDRLHKIRLELEDLRRHCGRSDDEALEALKRTCKEQEEEIARLKKTHELLQGQLLDRLWAAEKHAWSMEAERNDLNILLSKKVLELNKLQLLYSEQSKKLLEAARALTTPSSSRHTSSCDVSK